MTIMKNFHLRVLVFLLVVLPTPRSQSISKTGQEKDSPSLGQCAYKCDEKDGENGEISPELGVTETNTIITDAELLNISALYRLSTLDRCMVVANHTAEPECDALQCGDVRINITDKFCSILIKFEPIYPTFCSEKSTYFDLSAEVDGDKTIVLTMNEILNDDEYYNCEQTTMDYFLSKSTAKDTISFEFDAGMKTLSTNKGSFLLLLSQKQTNAPSVLTLNYKFKEITLNVSADNCSCPDKGFIEVNCQCISLLYSKEPLTWTQSVEKCRNFQNSESNLWTIHDEEQYAKIENLVRSEWGLKRLLGNKKVWMFIGLQTVKKSGHSEERWIDDSPLAWGDWYHPAYRRQVPSIDLIFDKTKIQPNPNPNYVCTAMHVGPTRSFWIKLPCTFPAVNIGFMCVKPADKIDPSEITVRPMEALSFNLSFCQEDWYEYNDRCYMVLSTHYLYNCARSSFGSTEEELVNLCQKHNADVAKISKEFVKRESFQYIIAKMRPQFGDTMYMDLDGQPQSVRKQNNIFKVKENRELFDYLVNDTQYILDFRVCENSTFNYFLNPNHSLEEPGVTNVICSRDKVRYPQVCNIKNMFECSDSSCIAIDRRCDGFRDCDNDEEDCGNLEMFVCSDNSTIPYSRVCNFIQDCPGNDDENCRINHCNENEFECDNGQCIALKEKCDFHVNCRDGSDEKSVMCDSRCTELACVPNVECRGFTCFSGKCIPEELVNDLYVDCESAEEDEVSRPETVVRGNWIMKTRAVRGQSMLRVMPYSNFTAYCPKPNEARCHEYHERCFDRSQICIYDLDVNGILKGCRDGSHLKNCRDYACAGAFKCPKAYCLPVRRVCDGVRDCPDGADEDQYMCRNYTCPGRYRCKDSVSCIDLDQVCDGIVDCPKSFDDERLCPPLSCLPPPACSCSAFELTCTGLIDVRLMYFHLHLRYLKITNSTFSMMSIHFRNLQFLIFLNFSANQIESIESTSLHELKNLRILDLSHNRINTIKSNVFEPLNVLETLLLKGNPLTTIEAHAFNGLVSVSALDLSDMNIAQVDNYAFSGMIKLQELNLSRNFLKVIPDFAFQDLENMEWMDLTENTITVLEPNVFKGLNIRLLYTDAFRFCCAANRSVENLHCTPAADEFSNCFDLMANSYLQIAIWIMGITALVGNFGVFIYRVTHDKHLVTSMLIMNLSISDFLMGVYLLIIASADTYYRGRYVIYDEQWRRGPLCRLAGALNLLSSEMSVLLLVIISLDRAVAIARPFSSKRLDTHTAKIALALAWALGIFFAGIPLVNVGYFQTFYGRNAPCLPFDVNAASTEGWEYAFGLVIFNFIAFLIILLAYVVIYIEVRRTRKAVNRSNDRNTEMAFLSKISMIVLSNFIAWFPVLIVKFLALNGLKIAPSASAWMAVFVLPVNASVNPCLYTLSAISARQSPTNSSQHSHRVNVYSVPSHDRVHNKK